MERLESGWNVRQLIDGSKPFHLTPFVFLSKLLLATSACGITYVFCSSWQFIFFLLLQEEEVKNAWQFLNEMSKRDEIGRIMWFLVWMPVGSGVFFFFFLDKDRAQHHPISPSPPFSTRHGLRNLIFLLYFSKLMRNNKKGDGVSWCHLIIIPKKASSWNGNPHTRKFEASACVCRIVVTVVNTSKFSLRRREIPKYSFTNYLGIEYLSISLSQVLNINCLLVSIERARENA